MSYTINRLITPYNSNTASRNKNNINYIVLHYVGAMGQAQANCKYYAEQYVGASAHLYCDSTSIWRSVEDKDVAWHCGANSYKHAYCRNTNSIGIEMCLQLNVPGTKVPAGVTSEWYRNNTHITEETLKRVVWLTQELMKKYDVPIENVLRHYDVTGKDCPAQYINSTAWNNLKNRIATTTVKPQTGTTPIIAAPTATLAQLKTWAKEKGASQLFIDLADTYWNLSVKVGVNPVITYAQSAKETGYGNFKNCVLNASYCNPCGLKTKNGGDDYDPNAHQKFASWNDGISAQVDHLAIYAGAAGYPKAANETKDPRHFASIYGKAPTVEALGGAWAPSSTYGVEIKNMMDIIKNTKAVETTPAPTPVNPYDEAPQWQKDGLQSLIDFGAIVDPTYWKNTFNDKVTKAELIGLLGITIKKINEKLNSLK